MMSRFVLVLAVLAASTAYAESPPESCADRYCGGAGFLEARTVTVGSTEMELEVIAGFGSASDAVPGSTITVSNEAYVFGLGPGVTDLFRVRGDVATGLVVEEWFDDIQNVEHCFGEYPAVADIAALLLANDCREQMPELPEETVSEDDGGCAAGGVPGAASLLVALSVFARRRRR